MSFNKIMIQSSTEILLNVKSMMTVPVMLTYALQ